MYDECNRFLSVIECKCNICIYILLHPCTLDERKRRARDSCNVDAREDLRDTGARNTAAGMTCAKGGI